MPLFEVKSSTPTDAKSHVEALWNKGRCCLNSLCCWYQLRSFRCAPIRKFQTKVEWTRARNPPWRIVLRSRPLSLAEWFDRSDKKLIAPLCCLSTSFSVRLISVLWNTEWAPAMENILLQIDQVELLVYAQSALFQVLPSLLLSPQHNLCNSVAIFRLSTLSNESRTDDVIDLCARLW